MGATYTGRQMAKQRQVRIEQKSALAAMQKLETRSDEALESETKYKAAALAILGARAAERYDAKASRDYFRRAIAAARPQERMQLRRMADASLALAERRPDDLKQAVERLGQAPPSSRQLLLLRFMGLVAPPPGAPLWLRIRGIALILLLVIVLLAVGLGLVELISLPFGGVGLAGALLLGFLLVIAALGVLALLGRRRQAKGREQRAAGVARPPPPGEGARERARGRAPLGRQRQFHPDHVVGHARQHARGPFDKARGGVQRVRGRHEARRRLEPHARAAAVTTRLR